MVSARSAHGAFRGPPRFLHHLNCSQLLSLLCFKHTHAHQPHLPGIQPQSRQYSGCITHCNRGHPAWGQWRVFVRGLERACPRIWACVRRLGKASRKQEFALHWVTWETDKLVTAMTPVGTAVSVLCVTTLYVNLPTRYSVLTPETFTSVCHHTADPLCLAEPLSVSPPVASALFSVAVCLLSAGLICSFIYCFAFSMPCISGVTCYVSLSVWLVSSGCTLYFNSKWKY